jgi:hypothetical protein
MNENFGIAKIPAIAEAARLQGVLQQCQPFGV